jgi:hypothetical protein
MCALLERILPGVEAAFLADIGLHAGLFER